jgi:hypothetical protein
MKHSKEYEKLIRHTIEDILGWNISDFSYYEKKDGSGSISFRPSDSITLQQITKLSEALGTDAIDFDFGHSGEPGYSDYTPGTDAAPGEIIIYLPITLKDPNEQFS